MRATEATPGVVYDVSVDDGEHWNRMLYAPTRSEDQCPWWWEEEDMWISVVDDAGIREVFNPHLEKAPTQADVGQQFVTKEHYASEQQKLWSAINMLTYQIRGLDKSGKNHV